MRAFLWILTVCSLGLAGCKAAPRPFPAPDETRVIAEPIRAEFHPPEGQPIRERSTQTRVEAPSGGAPATEVLEAEMESTFTRDGEDWRLVQRVPSVKLTENGTEVQNELAQLVTKFPITVRIASDGSFVELLNAEEIETALREAFPDPRMQEMVLSSFTPQAVEQEAKSEWTSKYGDLLGRDLRAGMAFYTVESVGTSRGDVAFVLERKVTGTRLGDEGREVVFELSCPTKAEKAANPEAAQQALTAKGNPELEPSVKCKGSQVLGLEPFVPRSTQLEVNALLGADTKEPLEMIFTRKVQTEKVGAAAAHELSVDRTHGASGHGLEREPDLDR
ncbi:MAG: hypothetical protein IRZ16_06235 [Myxococcaceae bacterium]|nr:hypothetical protein [Myxococcaceae bacterium]